MWSTFVVISLALDTGIGDAVPTTAVTASVATSAGGSPVTKPRVPATPTPAPIAAPAPAATPSRSGDRADIVNFTELLQSLQPGTLLFSQGDCLAVKVFSNSKFTHVGVVALDEGEYRVFDAMNGVGVRKSQVIDYLHLQQPSQLQVWHPATPLTEEQSALLTASLRQHLGRKYAVSHHLTGKRATGIHCAEYATDCLAAANVLSADNPPRVSPGSLLAGIEDYQLYVHGDTYDLTPPPNWPKSPTWYGQLWIDTKVCCRNSTSYFSRCVLCRSK